MSRAADASLFDKLVPDETPAERQQDAMQLRHMQTLNTIAGEKNSTIVFPLPIELLSRFADPSKRPSMSKL